MDEKLQEILRRQQESEYLKKQNITSRHQLQKLRSQAPGEYFSNILNQCIHMNRHTGTYRFLFILSNALAGVILAAFVCLLLQAWLESPQKIEEYISSIETPYDQAQTALEEDNPEKAREILETNHTPSDTFAGALVYSDLYEAEKNYDSAADVIITFITDILGTHNILKDSLLYTRMEEIGEMELSSEEKTKYDTCMTACKQSAADLASISNLISEKKYAEALKLCDKQKEKGSSEHILFEFYNTCYMNLGEYEDYADKLIELAGQIPTDDDYSYYYQFPTKNRIKSCLENLYPLVSAKTQKRIDALHL